MPTEIGVRRNALRKQRSRAGVVYPRVQVSEMQRARLLAAAVASIAELGYARASVAHITSRARVSRRTFYDLFEDREDCLLAILHDTMGRVENELIAANLDGLPWRERVRGGLWRILCFLDRDPVLAQVCVVQALQGGPRVLAWRGEILARLAHVLDEGCGENGRAGPPLTAEGLVGATLAILYARLVRAEREPLSGLIGELMGMIVLPFLGASAARREQDRLAPQVLLAERDMRDGDHRAAIENGSLADVPMRLTYRTARVLQATAEHPGASNRQIGEHAGLYDQGQISKLLRRLERLGLLQNAGGGQSKGEPNAWRLTTLGERVVEQLALNAHMHQDTAV